MSSPSPSYTDVQPLDWPQLQVFLWEAVARFTEQEHGWDRIASFVNERCPDSAARSSGDFERVLTRLRSVYESEDWSGQKEGFGARVWTRLLYESAQRLFGGLRFMNLGFAGGAPLELWEEDEPDRLFIQLYQEVVGAIDLRGLRVLEVGCGGGGGASYLARYLLPSEVVAVDLVDANLTMCMNAHGPGLIFVRADAERLAFRDGSFDAVLNIESSHSYANFQNFVAEVQRVLRPEGVFLFADLRPESNEWGSERSLSAVRRTLEQSLLRIEVERDITANVLQSMQLLEEVKRALLGLASLDDFERSHFHEIMLCEGSTNHARLSSGEWRYLCFALRKPR